MATSTSTSARRIEVLAAGMQTTVQDLAGRRGLWGVGVPPSGAFDDYACALANLAVGNDPGAAALEAVLTGPRLRFHGRALIAVTGACRAARLCGRPLRPGVPAAVQPGDELDFGPCGPPGLRGYLAVRGGIDTPRVLGSRATFLLGRFGGAGGRALAAGDVLTLGREENCGAPADCGPLPPTLTETWALRVIPGPHGAPEYFDDDALADLFAAEWTVDHRSDRTGIRLAGPAVRFARPDGGEAGLHPCNIHDSAYPVGGIMVSGDTPVIVGPDGPSLGGFVVPAAVVRADLWKLGQLRPGDSVRLTPVTPDVAAQASATRRATLADARETVASAADPPRRTDRIATATHERPEPLLAVAARGDRPELIVRYSGDHHVLVEAGPPRLDLTVRARIHLLARELKRREPAVVTESVEGVRSLLLAFDTTDASGAARSAERLARQIEDVWLALPDPRGIELDVREVTLPI